MILCDTKQLNWATKYDPTIRTRFKVVSTPSFLKFVLHSKVYLASSFESV